MRLALVVHAFPPRARTGVEVYTASLARALAEAGDDVHVFAACRERDRVHLEQRTEDRGAYRVTWLNLVEQVDDEDARRVAPGAAEAFGRFLDRERPEVCHLQHLVGFGPGIVDEARRREVPVVFTAQDAFAACEDYALLQPDLTALDPTDFVQAARCRIARGELDANLDAHDGWLVPGADGPEADAVARALRGEGEDAKRVRGLATRLAAEARARLDALERCDLVEAPTAFLRDVLTGAGLRKDVRVRALGIDGASLVRVERPTSPRPAAADEPLRVLYLGGYYEHKGVHVLLEAADGLAAEVTLTLRGCAGSSGYAARLAARAAEVGADLGGPFERAELPALLEACDVVALPSLWPENAPFVIREAFAAGRPVVASDTPALRESVRDGVDGRLVAQGDVAAWRGALRELAAEPAALARLAAGVRAPKSIAADAAELREDHARLASERAEARARRRRRLPAHLHAFAARYEALERLPLEELVARTSRGLAARAERLGVDVPGIGALQAAGALGARLRERVAGLAREGAWRADAARERESGGAHLEARARAAEEAAASERERAAWEGELRAEREARLAWREEALADREAELAAVRAELELATRTRAALDAQLAELRAGFDVLNEEREWLAGQREADAERAAWEAERRAALEAELAWRREQVGGLAAHRDELERQLDGERATAAAQLEALRAEYEALARSNEAARVALDGLASEHEALASDREAARAHEQHLEAVLADGRARLAHLEQERKRREDEMRAATSEGRGLARRAFGRELRRRLARWRAELGSSGVAPLGGDAAGAKDAAAGGEARGGSSAPSTDREAPR